MACNINTVLQNAATNGFTGFSERELRICLLELLCETAGSGTDAISNALSDLLSAHNVLSNRVSANSAVGGVASVTSTEASVISANAATGINTVSNNLSIETSNRISADNALSVKIDTVSQAHSVLSVFANTTLSNNISAVSAAVTSVDTRLNTLSNVVSLLSVYANTTLSNNISIASAAATSVDARLNTVSQQVSVLSQAHSVLSVFANTTLSNNISITSAAVTSVDARLNTVSNQVSVLSQALSVLSVFANTTLSNNISITSAAVTSVDARVNTVSNQVSILSQALSIISAGLGTTQMKVVTNVQGVSAASSKISGLSCSVAANGVYQLDAMLLYSTSGTANVYKFGMSVSGVTNGGVAGLWYVMVSAVNNTLTSTGIVVGAFNTVNGAQVSALPGTTGIAALARLDALFVVSTTGGTIRLETGASVTTAPINIMKGSYLRAYKIA